MRKKVLAFIAILAVATFGLGCESYQAYRTAKEALAKAKDAHADILAPYEYISAELYLQEAKKQLDDSDFAAAMKFANKSYAFSIDAIKKAEEIMSKPQIPFMEGKKLKEKFGLPWPPQQGSGKSQ